MTATHCVACGQDGMAAIRRYRSKTRHGRAVFGNTWLYECKHCGQVQAVPQPSLAELEDYYLVDYRKGCFAGADVADVEKFPKDNLYYYNRGRSIAELVSGFLSTDSPVVLDIGAGYGHILHAIGERYPGARRQAIEFSEVCVSHLESIGIRVHKRPAEEALPEMNQQFDLIILSHVLEHLLEPRNVLRLIRERLSPDGLLYIEVPNIPTESLRRYPDNVWAPRFEEPHVTFFSTKTLHHLLETSDYDVEFCDTAGPEYRYISWLEFHMPHWRWALQKMMPSTFFHYLRRQRITSSLRVKEQETAFDSYGGFRIWIRCISKVSPNSTGVE